MQGEIIKMNSILEQDILRVCETNRELEELSGSTVLITGATGFVGSFLAYTLLYNAQARGADIRIIATVRNEVRAREMFGRFEEKGWVRFLVQDVREPIACEEPIDYIIHCASNAGPREYGADPVGTMTTNFLGTQHLLDLAREKKVRKFLYVSTIEVYGDTQIEGAIGEHDFGTMDSTNVRSCYPLSKKACETLAVSYQDQYQVPAVIGRLSYLYGPGMKKDDSKVVAQFARDIAGNRDIVMKSKGEQLRSYTYISDAASALFTILAKGMPGEAYNIANPQSRMTIAQMARTLAGLYPERGLKVIFDLPTETEQKRFSFIHDAVLDTEKLEGLGYRGEVSGETGLRRMVESMEEDI